VEELRQGDWQVEVVPFSQTQADSFEEEHKEKFGYYAGHDTDCPERSTVPFTLSRCSCGPKPPDDGDHRDG
jgi:hypothetical protein